MGVSDIAVEAVVISDLLINIHREFVHSFSSKFYLVISMLYIEHTNEASKQRKTMPH